MAVEITDTGPTTAVHVIDNGETTAVVVNVPGLRGIKGDKGDAGDVGPANVLSIGTVSNGAPGATGSVTITGTSPTQILNFTLPVAAQMGTSATSFAIGTGSKVFVTQANMAFQVGGYVRIASRANGANYMAGNITAYTTTSLTVNITETGGSGTFTDWNINASGVKGNAGGTGPAPIISTTSATSLVIGTGSKVFTTAAAMNLSVGQTVKAWATANTSNYMVGQITAISGTSLTVNVTEIGGSGTIAAWTIALGSFRGGGIPVGGVLGDLAYKNSGTDFDVTWISSSATAAGNSIAARDPNGNSAFNRVTVNGQTPQTSDELTRKDYVDSQVATRLATKGNALVSLTANAEFIGKFEITDDGTDSANWPNRLEFSYKPVAGTSRLTTFFNEYGEFRGISAKSTTVPFRLFTKTAPADAAHTANMVEIQDDRTTRGVLFNIDSAGGVYTAKAAPTATNELTRKDYVDGKTWPSSAISDATAAATANMVIKRDASGRAQVAAPSVAADIARKDTVDAVGTRVTTLEGYNKVLVLAAGAAVPGGTPANTVIFRTA